MTSCLHPVAGKDYGFDVMHHPDEHELPMTVEHLQELRTALHGMGTTARREIHDDFVIFPL